MAHSAHPRTASGAGAGLAEGPNRVGAPAGFWRRYAAWSLDAVPIAIAVLPFARRGLADGFAAFGVAFDTLSATLAGLLVEGLASMRPLPALAQQWLQDPSLRAATASLQSALAAIALLPLVGFVAVALVYGVVFERSAWRATPGKRALGLAVVDDAGGRLRAGHALVRFCAGALSWLTLNLGHALAALPPQHRALHDRLSGTRVVQVDDGAAFPAWAKAWLVLQGAAFVVVNAWALLALHRVLQAAVARALLQ